MFSTLITKANTNPVKMDSAFAIQLSTRDHLNSSTLWRRKWDGQQPGSFVNWKPSGTSFIPSILGARVIEMVSPFYIRVTIFLKCLIDLYIPLVMIIMPLTRYAHELRLIH